MTHEHFKQAIYRTLLFSGISGYEIAASLTSLSGVLSTPASIGVRLFVVSCALIAISMDFGKAQFGSRRLILGYCIFWYAYLLRIAYATTLSSEPLMLPAWQYYSWAVGACALPMLGLSLWSPRKEEGDRNFLTLFLVLVCGGVLASFGASSIEVNQNNEMVDTGRLQLTALNPILLGQLGTTILVMSVWVLSNRYQMHRLTMKIIFSAAVLLGAGLLIGSNSRGPLVSAIVCLLFISIASNSRSRLYAISFLVVAFVSFAPATQYLETEYGLTTYTRLFGQSQLTEENTLDRLSRQAGAFNAFMESPLFGASLEEPTYGGYPHNMFIEALMSTGIISAALLFILLSMTFTYAVRLYVEVKGYGWASVLFIQYLVASQFSGSIYTVNYLWITNGLVIAIYSSLYIANKSNRKISIISSI